MNMLKAISFKTGLIALVLLSVAGTTGGAFADYRAYNNNNQSTLRNLWNKPVVRDAAVGSAIGVGAGLFTHKTSVGKGAIAGGLAGAGTGALRQSTYFRDKPLVRNTLQGAVIGTGASYATDSNRLKGAAVGAGAGAGYHYIRKFLDERY